MRVIYHQGVRPDLPTKFKPNWRYFRPSNLTFFAFFDVFTQNLSQSGCYEIIFKNFDKRYEIQTKNITESHRQRNFCKKPHVKSSFRSEEDSVRSYTQTDRQTDKSFYSLYRLGFHPSHIYITYHINRSFITLEFQVFCVIYQM